MPPKIPKHLLVAIIPLGGLSQTYDIIHQVFITWNRVEILKTCFLCSVSNYTIFLRSSLQDRGVHSLCEAVKITHSKATTQPYGKSVFATSTAAALLFPAISKSGWGWGWRQVAAVSIAYKEHWLCTVAIKTCHLLLPIYVPIWCPATRVWTNLKIKMFSGWLSVSTNRKWSKRTMKVFYC